MGAVTISGPELVLEEFNATDDVSILGHCLHDLFQDAADKHGDKTAVICADIELNFGELNGLANRFARDFVEWGVGRGDLVGVALNRSVDLVAVLLAVLKTGAAYVPIDPAFPAERIGHMIDDAQPKLVVVEAITKKALSFWRGPCLSIDEMRAKASNADSKTFGSNLGVEVEADDLAYLIYTSGSTGKPKGVEISHGALCNLLCAMKREPGCTGTDRLLAVTTISFDIAALELFVPLLSGAMTVVARTHESKDPSALMALMQRYAITMMQGTPSTWQMMLDAGWRGQPRLSKILCGGEALSRQLAERLLTCADSVWNLYGPTEATVWASVWRVRHGQDVVIGRPIANYRLYVLGEHLEPVPLGSEGELYIGGAGLAKGYHNMPKTTWSRFLPHHNPSGAGRLYRTGDLARFEDAESLSILGRADGQVKIRGYRIEVGDIEAAITAHGGISEVVVVSKDDRLVAYCRRDVGVGMHVVVPGPEEEAAVRVHAPTLSSILRPWLAQRLPDYMMPAFFVELGAFPMTPNNKVDRNALPDPTETILPIKMPPFTAMEDSIRLTWSKVLGHDRIGIHDNFFQIGGDSMRAVRVMKALERLSNRTLSPAILFEHFTIRTLAAYLNGDGETKTWAPVRPRQSLGENEDIAVVSMACRLPGGVTTPEEYWELLEHGVDATTDVPKDRWDAGAFYDADPDACGKSYCQRGGFLTSIDDFDASFFAISPREARAMDPAQRVMLETCWEAFERAGYTMHQLRGSQTGVYIGVCSISAHSPTTALAALDGYAATGSAGGTMSGRVSYALGLEGPALTVDTACSSSLVTTHLACNALRQGECDVAVSGGVSLLLTPAMHIEFSRLRAMSTDGRCRAFAADAQGTAWAEGCTAIVLKRLSDAVCHGDVIHAILRGTAVNHVGRSAAGLTVPSGPSQQ
jgi:amino acid adenylation domain-containing protein